MRIQKIKKRIKNSNNRLTKMNLRREVYNLMFINNLDNFKTYRKILFGIGKTIKYTLWLSFGLFWYHMYLLKKTDKPENGFLANDAFLNFAKSADYAFYDLK